MKFQFNFHQVDVSSSLRSYSEDHLSKAGLLLLKDSQWKVFYSMIRNECHVSVTVQCGWGHFKASARAEDFYASVDQVADKLERQFQKRKEVLQHHKKPERTKQARLARLLPEMETAAASFYKKAA